MGPLQQTVGGLPQQPTFKDALTNPKPSQSMESLTPDPTTRGRIATHKGFPSVLFSSNQIETLSSLFPWTLVGKFAKGYNKDYPDLGRPPVEVLQKFFESMDLKGEFQIGLLDNRHLLIRMSQSEDYLRLYSRPVWYVKGMSMRIFKWTNKFHVDRESSVVPIWITLPRLPIHFFSQNALFSIASAVGNPLRMDAATRSLKRPSLARVQVEIDVLKDRPNKLWIGCEDGEGFWQRIEYDDIPSYCKHCWHLGHSEDQCHIQHPELKQTGKSQETLPKQRQQYPVNGQKQQRPLQPSQKLPAVKEDKGKAPVELPSTAVLEQENYPVHGPSATADGSESPSLIVPSNQDPHMATGVIPHTATGVMPNRVKTAIPMSDAAISTVISIPEVPTVQAEPTAMPSSPEKDERAVLIPEVSVQESGAEEATINEEAILEPIAVGKSFEPIEEATLKPIVDFRFDVSQRNPIPLSAENFSASSSITRPAQTSTPVPSLNINAMAWQPQELGKSLPHGRQLPRSFASNFDANTSGDDYGNWHTEESDEEEVEVNVDDYDSMEEFMDRQYVRDDMYLEKRRNRQLRSERDLVRLRRGRGRPLGSRNRTVFEAHPMTTRSRTMD